MMTTQLNWLGCHSCDKWEHRILEALESFAASKTISKAEVTVEHLTEGTTPFRLSMMLSIPGPDIISKGTGQTFEEAMVKLVNAAQKTIKTREMQAQRRSGAARGVKPAFRG